MSGPRVSVAMPVRNARPYLDESIGSILGQTMGDLEFVILDDGSTDGSLELLREHARSDARIRLSERGRLDRSAGTFNDVVMQTTAPLVARMDADDVSHPDRLRRQVEVMEHREDAVAVGSLAEGIDARSRRVRPRDRWRLIRCSEVPFPHASAMFRREAFDRIGGYRPAAGFWADVDLCLRLADAGRVLVLPDALYIYRFHASSSTVASSLDEALREAELLRRSLAVKRAGREYDHILARDGGDRPSADAIAATLYLRGAQRLWAGEPPGTLEQLIRSRAWSLSPRYLRTLAWAVWARVSPSTLRACLRMLIRARDLAAGVRLRDGVPCEWRFR